MTYREKAMSIDPRRIAAAIALGVACAELSFWKIVVVILCLFIMVPANEEISE